MMAAEKAMLQPEVMQTCSGSDGAAVVGGHVGGERRAQFRQAEDVGVEAGARLVRGAGHLVQQLGRGRIAGHGLAEIEQLAVAQARPDPGLGLHDRRCLDPGNGRIDGICHDGAPRRDWKARPRCRAT